MNFLGQAISQSEPIAARLLAEQLVGILPDFMGGPLPVPDEDAVELMKAAILKSIALCDDYRAEIEAVIEFVDKNLRDHSITYMIHGNSKNRP
jgi:hypothetical protein